MFGLLRKSWDNSKIIAAIEGVIREYENGNILELQRWYHNLYKEAYRQGVRNRVSAEQIINDVAKMLPSKKYGRYMEIVELLSKKGGPLEEVNEYLGNIGYMSRPVRFFSGNLSEAESEVQEEVYDFDNESEMEISPNLPNITKCDPIKWFDIGDYSAVIVKNAPNLAGIPSPVEYLYVMALFSESGSMPIFYVTAEKSFTGRVFLCTFDKQGNHSNYGSDSDWSNINIFAKEALSILKSEVSRLDDDIPF